MSGHGQKSLVLLLAGATLAGCGLTGLRAAPGDTAFCTYVAGMPNDELYSVPRSLRDGIEDGQLTGLLQLALRDAFDRRITWSEAHARVLTRCRALRAVP